MLRMLPLLAVLGACSPAISSQPATPTITLVPDANGLGVAPLGKRMDFGRSPTHMIAALDRELGSHRVLGLTGCPATIRQHLQWGTLVLSFTDEQFVGWRQDGVAQGVTCSQ